MDEDKRPDVGGVREFLREREGYRDAVGAKKEAAAKHKATFIDGSRINKTAMSWAERLDTLSAEVRADVIRSLKLVMEEMAAVWAQEETEEMFPDKPKEEPFEVPADHMAAEVTPPKKPRGRPRRPKPNAPVVEATDFTPEEDPETPDFDQIEEGPIGADEEFMEG